VVLLVCDERLHNMEHDGDIFAFMRGKGGHILRVGLAITFLWVGLLILKDPVGWGAYIGSWAVSYLPAEVYQVMRFTAVFDIFIGVWLLLDYYLWIPAGLAAFHLGIVVFISGINAITVRDIGLFAASLALVFESFPVRAK
jgi:hypothetical protein